MWLELWHVWTSLINPLQALFIPDEQREKLMRKYRNLPQSPVKRRGSPQSDAIILARRLYMLDGFMKSEVAEKLSDP